MAKLLRQLVENMAQSRGLKMTPQRRAIIDYMQSAFHHPTADEVLQTVNSKFPMTSRATVYNTLKWLKQEGMIKEVFEAGSIRFDPNTEQHHHFVCRECGKVEDIECDLVGTVDICSLPASQKVEFFEVTLRGLCAGCQNK
jgi:Fur family ferric uptake transcriptional regulator/Fur family peroxide stress response transcriptional regulator